MKEWQQGYEIEYLKKLTAIVKKEFKPFVYGAFGLPNDRDIATCLKKDQVVITKEKDSILIFQEYKARSFIKDFTGEKVEIRPGDIVVKHFAGDQKEKILSHVLRSVPGRRVFVEIFEENKEQKDLMSKLDLEFIMTKIAASSDLKGIYWKTWENGSQDHGYALMYGEEIHCKETDPKFLTKKELDGIRKEVEDYNTFEDHYSGYNKRQSWSAFAIRGYDLDPNFIVKPGEMSKKWKGENPTKLLARSDWTKIADQFPTIKKILKKDIFKDCDLDRVRLMRLKSGKGELSRHADITDKEAGIQKGRVVRMHIPITTNDRVIFHSWDHRGGKKEVIMKEGSLVYLDVRKPHTATNTGDQDRIHLVIDLYSSSNFTEYLIEA